MSQVTVENVPIADQSKVINAVTLGFAADPVTRWVWPDAETYLDAMPEFVALFSGPGLDHQTVYRTDCGKGVAMWMPPGVEADNDAAIALLAGTVAPERLEEVGAYFELMDEFHPEERCWYLPFIAADPAFTGRGLGAALMKHALRRCDEDGLPAYLESSNPRNISLYERHGFEAIGQIQPGDSPLMTPMLRMPRK